MEKLTYADLIPNMVKEFKRSNFHSRTSKVGPNLGLSGKGVLGFVWEWHRKLPNLITYDIESQEFRTKVRAAGKPKPLPFGVSPRGAELYVAEWLRFLYFQNIEITPPRRDGGFDVAADDYLVEVKNWHRDWIPVSVVREIYGVAHLAGKKAMIFSAGYLSEDALKFSVDGGVAVFMFNAENAMLQPGNVHAEYLLETKLSEKEIGLSLQISDFQNKLAEESVDIFNRYLVKLLGGLSRSNVEWDEFLRKAGSEKILRETRISAGATSRLVQAIFGDEAISLEEKLAMSVRIGLEDKKLAERVFKKTSKLLNLLSPMGQPALAKTPDLPEFIY